MEKNTFFSAYCGTYVKKNGGHLKHLKKMFVSQCTGYFGITVNFNSSILGTKNHTRIKTR